MGDYFPMNRRYVFAKGGVKATQFSKMLVDLNKSFFDIGKIFIVLGTNDCINYNNFSDKLVFDSVSDILYKLNSMFPFAEIIYVPVFITIKVRPSICEHFMKIVCDVINKCNIAVIGRSLNELHGVNLNKDGVHLSKSGYKILSNYCL